MIRRFVEDETGATVVEYALIVVGLSLVVVAGMSQVSDALLWLFSSNESKLRSAFP